MTRQTEQRKPTQWIAEMQRRGEPVQWVMQKGPPIDGVTLAGNAETGDYLDVLGHGSYVNVGTKASPVWIKRYLS